MKAEQHHLLMGNVFTVTEIYQKVAVRVGIALDANAADIKYGCLHLGTATASDRSSGCSLPIPCSEPIKTYRLDAALLAALAERGIVRQTLERDTRSHRAYPFFDLMDKTQNDDEYSSEPPSNYWSFALPEKKKSEEEEKGKDKPELQISIGVTLTIETRDGRGILLMPQARASYSSPANAGPNRKMFRVLVERDADASPLMKNLATADRGVTIPFSDIGLDGVLELAVLFNAFAGENQDIENVGHKLDIFDPQPYQRHDRRADERIFVTKPVHHQLMQLWQKQLDEFRARLIRR